MIMNGKAPTLISGVPNVAPSRGDDQVAGQRDARARRPARARWRRRSSACPARRSARNRPREALGAQVLVDERHVGREARRGWRRAENTFSCEEVEHDAAHGLVVAGRVKAAISSSSSSSDSALRVSGWSSVIVATPVARLVPQRLVAHAATLMETSGPGRSDGSCSRARRLTVDPNAAGGGTQGLRASGPGANRVHSSHL